MLAPRSRQQQERWVLPPLMTRWSSSQMRSSMTWRRVGVRGSRVKCPMPPMPNAQCPVPSAQCPMPGGRGAHLVGLAEHRGVVGLVALHVGEGDHERAAGELGDAAQ
eukprot:scaffold131983_cov36-Phaeocystis_antarctica.AAC.1